MKGLGIVLAAQRLSTMVANAAKAEAAGFETVWTAELHRSIFVPLAAIAGHTQRAALGTGIALAFVRSPLIAALTALDMDELTGGRFILGLGSGVQRLNEAWHNVRYGAPAPHLRETVEATRLIIQNAHRGKPITYQGSYYNLDIQGYRRPFEPTRPTIPIFMAAVGPVMCRTAGQVADGWLGHMLGSPRWFKDQIQPSILRGLQQAGRKPTDFQFVPTLTCAVDKDRKQAKRVLAGTVAFYATVRTYTDFFAFHGFGKEAAAIQEAFHQRRDIRAATEAVPDAMVDALGAAGTKDEVHHKVREHIDMAGAVALSGPHYFIPEEQVAHYESALIESFA